LFERCNFLSKRSDLVEYLGESDLSDNPLHEGSTSSGRLHLEHSEL
jgi:hypothetical protein